MDGHEFVSKLQHLKIPGSELLKTNDFDWIFLEDSNHTLSLFWKWFFTHVNPEDVLSEEELCRYSELLSSGSVFSEKHLNQIDDCSESILLAEDFPPLYFTSDEVLEDEVILLEERFKRLKEKRDFISLQRMEAEEHVKKRRNYIKEFQHDLEKGKWPVQRVCIDYSRAAEEISASIQATVLPFLSFMCSGNEAKFISQISNCNWSENEINFREALFKYIHKQFQEGMETFVGQDDESTCCSLESTQLNIQFVRGPKQAEYLRNVKDLHRVSQMLAETEIDTIHYNLKKAEKEAEMNEAIKFQGTLESKKLISLPYINEQISHLMETSYALEQDLQFQKDHLKELGDSVSKTEFFRVVSGSYEFKLKRQEYFLSKQQIVRDFLISQHSRLDLMKIIYDIEKQMISTILTILVNLNKTLRAEFQGSSQRLTELSRLKESFGECGLAVKEKKYLHTLLDDFDNDKYKEKSDANLLQIVRQIESSLKNSENEIQRLGEYRMRSINQLFSSCFGLEECLFGARNSIGNFPDSWINCKIVDRQAKIENTMGALQQEMFQVLKNYEKKKKIIQDTPSIQEDLNKWTKDF